MRTGITLTYPARCFPHPWRLVGSAMYYAAPRSASRSPDVDGAPPRSRANSLSAEPDERVRARLIRFVGVFTLYIPNSDRDVEPEHVAKNGTCATHGQRMAANATNEN